MSKSLLENLNYKPQILKFGTSGRRGEVVHLSQLEIYINALAELEYLQSLSEKDGGIKREDEFYFAYDLRPSSTKFVPEQGGRGEIVSAIQQAITDAGMKPVNLGALPTPALTSYALSHHRGSMMVTGSHIPFDRNGYKTNSSKGELLKKDEPPIGARVEVVRDRLYKQPSDQSAFDESGKLKVRPTSLPEHREARTAYLKRYTDFFTSGALSGKKIVLYQHSAVGRDLLAELLKMLGAIVIPVGRSDTFVPIDTEAICAAELAGIQSLTTKAVQQHGMVDAVVSIDGDSDRPLVLGVDEAGQVQFFGGDLVGMVVAEYLGADAVVVPISCNDAIDRGSLKDKVANKTKIGSPFVIAGMSEAVSQGKKAVVGWEANGGFLTGSNISKNGKTITALPTRDAFLPILATLFRAFEQKLSVIDLFDRLPRRFSKASLLRNFPRATSMKIVEKFTPKSGESTTNIQKELEQFFTPGEGFGKISRMDYTDGVRIYFENGDVAHVRPSGNADELRIYAVADSQARADAIASAGVAEPRGILRRLAGHVE